MEFFDTYLNEIVIGGSTTMGTLIVAIIKKLANRMDKVDKRLMELEKKIEINTALDKERQRK